MDWTAVRRTASRAGQRDLREHPRRLQSAPGSLRRLMRRRPECWSATGSPLTTTASDLAVAAHCGPVARDYAVAACVSPAYLSSLTPARPAERRRARRPVAGPSARLVPPSGTGGTTTAIQTGVAHRDHGEGQGQRPPPGEFARAERGCGGPGGSRSVRRRARPSTRRAGCGRYATGRFYPSLPVDWRRVERLRELSQRRSQRAESPPLARRLREHDVQLRWHEQLQATIRN